MLDQVISQHVVTQLQSSNIVLGKIPASCSGIHQPLDVSPLFRAAKSRMKSVVAKASIVSNTVLETHVRNALSLLESKCNVSVKSEQKNKVVYGCSVIVQTLQDTVKRSHIVKGFETCGQYPLDFNKIMSQCYKDVDQEMLNKLLLSTNAHVEYFLDHGQLTDEQLDASDIPQSPTKKSVPRDERAIYNQRAVIVTHFSTVDRYQTHVNAGLNLGTTITACRDPVEKKNLKNAAKLVAASQKKEDKKKKEADRLANLSKEEIAAERAHKREIAAGKRIVKEADLQSAKALLVQAVSK